MMMKLKRFGRMAASSIPHKGVGAGHARDSMSDSINSDDLSAFIEGRCCVLGFGNRMWGDDGAGSLLAEALQGGSGPDAIDGGMVPENHLEKVARTRPDTVLLADAADFGGEPGEIRLMKPGDTVLSGVSTHAGSPQMLASYLEARTGACVGLLAIQPGDTGEGQGLSAEVGEVVDWLVEILEGF